MSPLYYAIGVVLLLVGVAVSIALHELGHLVPAKKFGVKVTQYMIGFGPTLFSRRRGETEYGIKAVPLGGFIAMPGMYPPEPATTVTAADPASGTRPAGISARRRPRRARLFEATMADARDFSNQEIGPGEEHRTFYALSVPKRLVVMFSGPLVNLVLGIGIMAIVLLGIGTLQPTTTVSSVVECAVPASEAEQRAGDECAPGDRRTPAWQVGIEPGDRIVAIGGQPTDDWDTLSDQVRSAAGTEVDVVIERDGERLTLEVPVIASERPALDADGNPVTGADGEVETVVTGFLGVSPTQEHQPMPPGEFAGKAVAMVGQTFHALITLPEKLVDIAQVAVTDEPRDPAGPMGMVGIGRVAGQIAATDQLEIIEKAQVGLSLLGSLNLFLFAFNMVPLLPLDGGHIAVALYEGARRRINLIRGRGVVGPFDTARLLPLTYVAVGLMLSMTALLLYVDIVDPVRLPL